MRRAVAEFLTAHPEYYLPVGVFFGLGFLVLFFGGLRSVITRRQKKSAQEIRYSTSRGDSSKEHKGTRAVFSGLFSLLISIVCGGLCTVSLLEYSSPGSYLFNKSDRDRENQAREKFEEFGDPFRKTAPSRSIRGLPARR